MPDFRYADVDTGWGKSKKNCPVSSEHITYDIVRRGKIHKLIGCRNCTRNYVVKLEKVYGYGIEQFEADE